MILVTGADYTHGAYLLQFLDSVWRNEPNTETVVYDLGLGAGMAKSLERIYYGRIRNLEIIPFPFDHFQPFMRMSAPNHGSYAWKAQCLRLVALSDLGCNIVWMDAGNVIDERLDKIRDALWRYGFYCPTSEGTTGEWVHAGQMVALGIVPRRSPMLNTACVGFNTGHLYAKKLLMDWAEYSTVESIIAPPGSNASNHRWEQSLLTLLAWQTWLQSPAEKLGFRTHVPLTFH